VEKKPACVRAGDQATLESPDFLPAAGAAGVLGAAGVDVVAGVLEPDEPSEEEVEAAAGAADSPLPATAGALEELLERLSLR
jgi:hypothetical protein